MGRSSVLDLAEDETDARASRVAGCNYLGLFLWRRQGKKNERIMLFKPRLRSKVPMCVLRLRQVRPGAGGINSSRGVGLPSA